MLRSIHFYFAFVIFAKLVNILRADDPQILEQQAENLCKQCESLEDRIIKVLPILKSERDLLPAKEKQIFNIVVRNPEIIEKNRTLENYSTEEVKQRCHPLFVQNVNLFIQELRQSFNQSMSNSMNTIETNLKQYQKNVAVIKDTLVNHLDDEMRNCRETKSPSCRITNQFEEEIKSHTKYLTTVESNLPSMLDVALKSFEDKVLPNLMSERLLIPALKCEKKSNGVIDKTLEHIRDALYSFEKIFE